jgi:hypothetical protein
MLKSKAAFPKTEVLGKPLLSNSFFMSLFQNSVGFETLKNIAFPEKETKNLQ